MAKEKFNATISMTFKKETPGTRVFEATTDDAVVKTLYIRKDAFKGKDVKEITLTVSE